MQLISYLVNRFVRMPQKQPGLLHHCLIHPVHDSTMTDLTNQRTQITGTQEQTSGIERDIAF